MQTICTASTRQHELGRTDRSIAAKKIGAFSGTFFSHWAAPSEVCIYGDPLPLFVKKNVSGTPASRYTHGVGKISSSIGAGGMHNKSGQI